jgi:hypothetical protein
MKNYVKTLLAAGLATLTSAVAFAGPTGYMKSMPKQIEVMPPPQAPLCFEANEWQLDLFSATVIDDDGDAFAGGGLAVNYFLTEYLGLGVEGYWFDGDDDWMHNANGMLILRYPFQEYCIAPYVYGGGGVQANGTNQGVGFVGGGVEWKAYENIGLFADGRWSWVEHFDESDGHVTIRGGLRFYF